jgi:ABC-type branched-subunit amino acid transport system ATPase component
VLSAGQLIAAGAPAEVQADDRVIASYMGRAGERVARRRPAS